MRRHVLLDTGPLVAWLNARSTHHEWMLGQWTEIEPPLLTCEAVLTEACFLLRNWFPGPAAVLELLERAVIVVPFVLAEHLDPIRRLMRKYADVGISLADACLVRMSECYPDAAVLTFDSDFRLYRRFGRQTIPAIMPPGQ
jgi:predicted nucleic acid-binding protein